MKKTFAIKKEEMVELLPNSGGCMATDRITVDNAGVNYMYRELSKIEADTGWRFFAGDESEDYMKDNSNHSFYLLNTIANYEPAIIEYIQIDAPCEFERIEGSNRFQRIK